MFLARNALPRAALVPDPVPADLECAAPVRTLRLNCYKVVRAYLVRQQVDLIGPLGPNFRHLLIIYFHYFETVQCTHLINERISEKFFINK